MNCNKCGKKFKSKTSLEYHIKNNVCEKRNKLQYECTGCKKKYSNKKTLNRHIKKNSCSNKKFNCPLCNSGFSSEYNMKRHLRSFCKQIKNNTGITNNITNNNHTNNNHSNNNNTTNNINNITNNIQINNFGNENIDNVDTKRLLKSIKNINRMPLDYIQLKYIDTPENRNVFLFDAGDQQMYILKNGEWIKRNKIKVLNSMLVGSIDAINDLNKKIVTDKKIQEKIDKRLDAIEEINKKNISQVRRVQEVVLDKNNYSLLHESFKLTNGKVS